MTNVLFVCSANLDRSPTAEELFQCFPGIETDSAGTDNDAVTPLSEEHILWADLIIVMEKAHREKIRRRFKSILKAQRLVCLDIPDHYKRGDPELTQLLEARVPKFLPRR